MQNVFVTKQDVKWKAVRASRPGGERTNRRSTKVQMWARIADLPLSEIEKKRLRAKLAHHVNHKDELEVESEEERSQELNRDRALARMNELIARAIKIPPPRIPTEPPRNAEEERIRKKKMVSAKKKSRRAA